MSLNLALLPMVLVSSDIFLSTTLNQRAHLENTDYTINENGIPCCPHDAGLPNET